MSPEWVGALAAIGTFVVIAASALAALVQMRHMRSANQISLFTAYNTEFDSPEFTAAFNFVRTELSAYPFSDEDVRALAQGVFIGPLHGARTIANFFEDMGSFVSLGLLHREIVCNLYALNVLDSWEAIAPILFFIRSQRKMPSVWENFEYLAVLSQEFVKHHPLGVYPVRLRRMSMDESLVTRYQALKQTEPGLSR